MKTVRFIAAAGGQTTTTIAVGYAAALASQGARVLLFGADPDPIAGMLGLPQIQEDQHGSILHVGDFSNSARMPLALAVSDTCDEGWSIDAFGEQYAADFLVMDNTYTPAERNWLVTKPCYNAIRAALRKDMSGKSLDGIVFVPETGRALSEADVAACLDSRVVARMPLRPDVARAVDAGLLTFHVTRHPEFRTLVRALAGGSDNPGT